VIFRRSLGLPARQVLLGLLPNFDRAKVTLLVCDARFRLFAPRCRCYIDGESISALRVNCSLAPTINAEHEAGQAASTVFKRMTRPGIVSAYQLLVVRAQPTASLSRLALR